MKARFGIDSSGETFKDYLNCKASDADWRGIKMFWFRPPLESLSSAMLDKDPEFRVPLQAVGLWKPIHMLELEEDCSVVVNSRHGRLKVISFSISSKASLFICDTSLRRTN